MNIQCDRCGQIYNSDSDVVVTYTKPHVIHGREYHLCGYCGLILQDFIEDNIELKKIGKHQHKQDEYNEVMDAYYDSPFKEDYTNDE